MFCYFEEQIIIKLHILNTVRKIHELIPSSINRRKIIDINPKYMGKKLAEINSTVDRAGKEYLSMHGKQTWKKIIKIKKKENWNIRELKNSCRYIKERLINKNYLK